MRKALHAQTKQKKRPNPYSRPKTVFMLPPDITEEQNKEMVDTILAAPIGTTFAIEWHKKDGVLSGIRNMKKASDILSRPTDYFKLIDMNDNIIKSVNVKGLRTVEFASFE